MHQDHGTSPAVCQRSIQLGFSSVMMDGSLREDGKTPADYEYNVAVTREVVKMAHACGVPVEGGIGVGSLETGMAGEEDGVALKASWITVITNFCRRSTPICCRYQCGMHLPLRSVPPLMVLTNSSAHQQAIFWRLTVSKKFTKLCQALISLCMVQAQYQEWLKIINENGGNWRNLWRSC